MYVCLSVCAWCVLCMVIQIEQPNMWGRCVCMCACVHACLRACVMLGDTFMGRIDWSSQFVCGTLLLRYLCAFRISEYNRSPHSGQVVFAQLMGMADYISSPLGKCYSCRHVFYISCGFISWPLTVATYKCSSYWKTEVVNMHIFAKHVIFVVNFLLKMLFYNVYGFDFCWLCSIISVYGLHLNVQLPFLLWWLCCDIPVYQLQSQWWIQPLKNVCCMNRWVRDTSLLLDPGRGFQRVAECW